MATAGSEMLTSGSGPELNSVSNRPEKTIPISVPTIPPVSYTIPPPRGSSHSRSPAPVLSSCFSSAASPSYFYSTDPSASSGNLSYLTFTPGLPNEHFAPTNSSCVNNLSSSSCSYFSSSGTFPFRHTTSSNNNNPGNNACTFASAASLPDYGAPYACFPASSPQPQPSLPFHAPSPIQAPLMNSSHIASSAPSSPCVAGTSSVQPSPHYRPNLYPHTPFGAPSQQQIPPQYPFYNMGNHAAMTTLPSQPLATFPPVHSPASFTGLESGALTNSHILRDAPSSSCSGWDSSASTMPNSALVETSPSFISFSASLPSNSALPHQDEASTLNAVAASGTNLSTPPSSTTSSTSLSSVDSTSLVVFAPTTSMADSGDTTTSDLDSHDEKTSSTTTGTTDVTQQAPLSPTSANALSAVKKPCCEVCQAVFASASSKSRHMQKYHGPGATARPKISHKKKMSLDGTSNISVQQAAQSTEQASESEKATENAKEERKENDETNKKVEQSKTKEKDDDEDDDEQTADEKTPTTPLVKKRKRKEKAVVVDEEGKKPEPKKRGRPADPEKKAKALEKAQKRELQKLMNLEKKRTRHKKQTEDSATTPNTTVAVATTTASAISTSAPPTLPVAVSAVSAPAPASTTASALPATATSATIATLGMPNASGEAGAPATSTNGSGDPQGAMLLNFWSRLPSDMQQSLLAQLLEANMSLWQLRQYTQDMGLPGAPPPSGIPLLPPGHSSLPPVPASVLPVPDHVNFSIPMPTVPSSSVTSNGVIHAMPETGPSLNEGFSEASPQLLPLMQDGIEFAEKNKEQLVDLQQHQQFKTGVEPKPNSVNLPLYSQSYLSSQRTNAEGPHFMLEQQRQRQAAWQQQQQQLHHQRLQQQAEQHHIQQQHQYQQQKQQQQQEQEQQEHQQRQQEKLQRQKELRQHDKLQRQEKFRHQQQQQMFLQHHLKQQRKLSHAQSLSHSSTHASSHGYPHTQPPSSSLAHSKASRIPDQTEEATLLVALSNAASANPEADARFLSEQKFMRAGNGVKSGGNGSSKRDMSPETWSGASSHSRSLYKQDEMGGLNRGYHSIAPDRTSGTHTNSNGARSKKILDQSVYVNPTTNISSQRKHARSNSGGFSYNHTSSNNNIYEGQEHYSLYHIPAAHNQTPTNRVGRHARHHSLPLLPVPLQEQPPVDTPPLPPSRSSSPPKRYQNKSSQIFRFLEKKKKAEDRAKNHGFPPKKDTIIVSSPSSPQNSALSPSPSEFGLSPSFHSTEPPPSPSLSPPHLSDSPHSHSPHSPRPHSSPRHRSPSFASSIPRSLPSPSRKRVKTSPSFLPNASLCILHSSSISPALSAISTSPNLSSSSPAILPHTSCSSSSCSSIPCSSSSSSSLQRSLTSPSSNSPRSHSLSCPSTTSSLPPSSSTSSCSSSLTSSSSSCSCSSCFSSSSSPSSSSCSTSASASSTTTTSTSATAATTASSSSSLPAKKSVEQDLEVLWLAPKLKTKHSASVLVIGAGPAGIMAARTLIDAGYKVTVVEARERWGGRIDTNTVGGNPVDFGATFIHGCDEANLAYQLARRLKLPLQERLLNDLVVFKESGNSSRVSKATIDQLRRVYFEVMDRVGLRAHARVESQQSDQPLSECFEASLLEQINVEKTRKNRKNPVLRTSKKSPEQIPTAEACILEHLKNASVGYCAELKDISACGFYFPVKKSPPEVGWVQCEKEGCGKWRRLPVVEGVDALELPPGEWVCANNFWDPARASCEASEEESIEVDPSRPPEVQLPVSPGDYMITTGYRSLLQPLVKEMDIRLGWEVASVSLGSSEVTVTRSSGEQLTADYAILTVPLGVLKAGSIKFDPVLSPRKQTAINQFGMGLENKIILHFSSAFWPSSNYFFSLHDTRYVFLNLDVYGKTGTLVVHCPPPHCREVESETDEAVLDQVLAALRLMFGNIPKPLSSHVTRWGQDKYSRGAYSFIPVGASVETALCLSEPEWDGRLGFAGEACSVAGHQCVHGALATGLRAARAISQQQTILENPFVIQGTEDSRSSG